MSEYKQHPVGEVLGLTMEKIKQMVDTDVIIGKPIHVDDVTIIPVSRISVGFASGGTDFSKKQSGSGDSNFGGGGGTGQTSGAGTITILGGTVLGLSRPTAAEFSFFLGLPTMCGAGALKAFKFWRAGGVLSPTEWQLLLIGAAVSFLVSLCTIRFFTEFVRRHSFVPFGVYRILLGAAGVLGVEGQSREVLYRALLPFAAESPAFRPGDITKQDFFRDGLTGSEHCTERRNALAAVFGLPPDMTPNALLAALRIVASREAYEAAVREIAGE